MLSRSPQETGILRCCQKYLPNALCHTGCPNDQMNFRICVDQGRRQLVNWGSFATSWDIVGPIIRIGYPFNEYFEMDSLGLDMPCLLSKLVSYIFRPILKLEASDLGRKLLIVISTFVMALACSERRTAKRSLKFTASIRWILSVVSVNAVSQTSEWSWR